MDMRNTTPEIYNKNVDFLKQIFKIMKRYNIHRIYRITYDNNNLSDAYIPLKSNIGRYKIIIKIFDFIDLYFPWLYFNIFYKIHIYNYEKKIKKTFKKYNIVTIGSSSFSLEKGIYIADDLLYVNDIDIINTEGSTYHIDKMCLNNN